MNLKYKEVILADVWLDSVSMPVVNCFGDEFRAYRNHCEARNRVLFGCLNQLAQNVGVSNTDFYCTEFGELR